MYGTNTILVEEVLEFARHGPLLSPEANAGTVGVPVRDLAEAKRLAWKEASLTGELSWTDLREREMSKVLKFRYDRPDAEALDRVLEPLVDTLGSVVMTRLRGTLRELVDDVSGDLYDCAYQRAMLGRVDGLFEKMFAAYRQGGWPCSWRGRFPDGQLQVYFP